MKMLRQRRTCPVGIDIRLDEIRMVKLARLSKGRYRMECADIGRLPSGQRSAVDWPALRELLGGMVKVRGLEGLPAVLSLPASGTRMQRIPLPANLPSYAIEAAVHGRLRQEMFGLTGSVCLDYVEFAAATAREKEVYFVASRQELLAQYVECAASAGLEVKIVDVDVFALRRAVSYLIDGDMVCHQLTGLLVNVDKSLEWIVYDNQMILFHHVIQKADMPSFALALPALIKKFGAVYPQLEIQRIIIMGKVTQDEQSGIRAQKIVPVHYVDSHPVFTPSELLTACGLSMRELPPWY